MLDLGKISSPLTKIIFWLSQSHFPVEWGWFLIDYMQRPLRCLKGNAWTFLFFLLLKRSQVQTNHLEAAMFPVLVVINSLGFWLAGDVSSGLRRISGLREY